VLEPVTVAHCRSPFAGPCCPCAYPAEWTDTRSELFPLAWVAMPGTPSSSSRMGWP
jgi:hypothetical protein